MDIKDGRYNLIRKGVFDFSFSPTDRRVTFIEELSSPPVVEILDLQLGTIDEVKLNVNNTYNQAKVDIWSEDGLRFIVKAVSGINYSHDVFNNDMFSVVIIDVNDLSQNIIVKDMPTTSLEVTEWTEDGIVTIKTGDETFGPIKFWHYDLKTEALVASTPSP